MEYSITIPGEMRGKQRARVTTRGGHARAYTPAQTVNAEAWVKQCAIDQGVIEPLHGPLRLSVAIQKAVPASWSKAKRASALSGGSRPTGKPDLDNCAKLLADSLNGICWQDDAQIVEMRLSKAYAERAFTTLLIEQV